MIGGNVGIPGDGMTETQLFAFVILPIVVAALGWRVALWHQRWAKRQ